MAESNAPIPVPVTRARAERIFPTLSDAQVQRLASHGKPRSVHTDEVLVELGDSDIPVFLVISGDVEIVRPSITTQETVWSQWVDATLAWSLSAGVWNPKVFRGR